MFRVGQKVNTKYGLGVVVCIGRNKPQVYVRMYSNLQLYILDMTSVATIDSRSAAYESANQPNLKQRPSGQYDLPACGGERDGAFSFRTSETDGREQMKNIQLAQQTPLASFVRERLAELGMRQADFCRSTGFDQGLLSKIQSSIVTSLSLESVLKLADGLSVSPREILTLIGRSDLHDLVMRLYSTELSPVAGADEPTPEPVLEISRMALRAYLAGRSLAPVFDLLSPMAVSSSELAEKAKPGEG